LPTLIPPSACNHEIAEEQARDHEEKRPGEEVVEIHPPPLCRNGEDSMKPQVRGPALGKFARDYNPA
jgi:hypothetical protein